MPMPLNEIEAEALHLPPEERVRLAGRLLQSLEAEPEDVPEGIAKAWEEEITRRIDELEAGRTESISYEQVRGELHAMIGAHRTR